MAGARRTTRPTSATPEKKWQNDNGVLEGRCNTAAVGAVIGGMVGGAVGSRVSSPQDRPVAAFTEGASPCRRFTALLASGQKKDSLKGAACRQGDGEWGFRS
jgi:surface antigen